MSDVRRARLRRGLRRYGRYLLAASLVLTVLGGWWTYGVYVSPGTQVEKRVESRWVTSGHFEHGATVREPNPVFEVGTRLENRSVYFTNLSRRLDGSFRFEYRASQSGNLSVSVTLRTIHESVTGDGATVWRIERVEGRKTVQVGPNRTVFVPFSIDIVETSRRLQRTLSKLGAAVGERHSRLTATVSLTGRVNGRSVDRTNNYSLSFTPGQSVYEVSGGAVVRNEQVETSTVRVRNEPGPVSRYGSLLLLLLPGIAGLTLWNLLRFRDWQREPVSERDEFLVARARFDDWVVAGTVPSDEKTEPVVHIDSLADLVEVAAESGTRIVEDDGTYLVLAAESTYRYDPPADEAEDGDSLADHAGDED